MRAIQLQQFGGSLELTDVPDPEINDDQVLVKVHAASVNQLEIKIATGNMQDFFPVKLPFIPGSDFAGVIEKVGKNVSGFKIGDEVYGQSASFGSYAEFVAANANAIALKPASLDFVQAASVPVVAMTAYQGIFQHGRLQAGQTVLIHGGAGAVGGYAVQLAKNGGGHVIATAAGEDLEYVRKLGAEKVIDYEHDKFEDHLEAADLVFDPIGGETQQRSYSVMKKGGHLIATSHPPKKEDAEKFGVNAEMMNMQASTKDLNELAVLLQDGTLKTDVAKTYPLEQAGEAWKAIGSNLQKGSAGEKIGHGKAVLQIV